MQLIQNAKVLRKRSTLAEVILWQRLNKNQLKVQFYRQKPLEKRYIADFYCAKYRLIVEVDGEYHNFTTEQDKYRTEYLHACGYTMVRFTNQQVLESIDYVISKIKYYLN